MPSVMIFLKENHLCDGRTLSIYKAVVSVVLFGPKFISVLEFW
jgi:hypothetical protein